MTYKQLINKILENPEMLNDIVEVYVIRDADGDTIYPATVDINEGFLVVK